VRILKNTLGEMMSSKSKDYKNTSFKAIIADGSLTFKEVGKEVFFLWFVKFGLGVSLENGDISD